MSFINNGETNTSIPLRFVTLSFYFLSLAAGIHAVIIFQRHLPMRLEIGFVLYMESKVWPTELMFSG